MACLLRSTIPYRTVTCGLPSCTIFFAHYLINITTFGGKELLNTKCEYKVFFQPNHILSSHRSTIQNLTGKEHVWMQNSLSNREYISPITLSRHASARARVCVCMYAVLLNLYFCHLPSTLAIFYLYMWPLCDTYNTKIFFEYFIRGTFFWDNALRISFTVVSSDTTYHYGLFCPSQIPGHVPVYTRYSTHSTRTAKRVSLSFEAIRLSTVFISGILYTYLFPHGLDIFNLKHASNHAVTLRVAAYIWFEENQCLPVPAISHENAEVWNDLIFRWCTMFFCRRMVWQNAWDIVVSVKLNKLFPVGCRPSLRHKWVRHILFVLKDCKRWTSLRCDLMVSAF
jgi:hypothetical protein